MIQLQKIDYNKYVENTFTNRYVNPIKFHDFLVDKYSNNLLNLGTSSLGLPIFKVSVGNGPINILAWTQMHGNESTGSLGMLDFLKYQNSISDASDFFNSHFTLDIIFMLNPDGAFNWTRNNAFGIDINRDYVNNSSPEIKILLHEVLSKNYDLTLNIHDQRSIFGLYKSKTPATLALLAPSINEHGDFNIARKKVIKIIGKIYKDLNKDFPNQISRFDETFYPLSCGDNFQKLGIPTMLIESGFYLNDYKRKHSRKLFFFTILSTLNSLVSIDALDDYTYFKIPENDSRFTDILIKNLKIISNSHSSLVDMSIQFKEVLVNDSIRYHPIIEFIGAMPDKFGWQEFDVHGMVIEYKPNLFVIGANATEILNTLNISYHDPNKE